MPQKLVAKRQKNPTEEEEAAAAACSLFMLSEEHRRPRKARPQTVMPRRTTPLQDATNHILAGRDKNSMLEIKYINPVKGRGIFTSAVFSQGDFVVEYRGELIDAAEAEHRRKLYHDARSIFMFDFTWKLKTWCIDGTLEDGSFGRLVNDEHKSPNCRMKLIEAEGKPHLCLFALKEITTGTEITYDYGGKEWPWRKEIPHALTSTAAQESIKDSFQDQIRSSTVFIKETRERPGVQSCNMTSGSSACETQLSGASIPSGQHSVAELGDHAHDLELNVFSTDLSRDTELRAECQSFGPTPDSPVHEVQCVGGQCSTVKEGIGEVGVQHQEVSPPMFSTDLASETKSGLECQSSRAAPNDSACECTIHKLVFELVRIDKCWICHSPLTSIRWPGLRCKHNEDMLASGTFGSPHLSETTAQDDLGNSVCVTSGSPHLPDSVTQGSRVSSRRCVKKPWTEKEIQAVMKHMRPFIENGLTATIQQCLKCREKEHPILETRSIQNIRDFVRNRGVAFKRHSEAKC
ncbi:uncharacterized protein LOC114465886 isoform X2 [Gouania willdenowi]|uniref:uncharacterized protein LOC114465886 isoform X2 n=1 Tax=Gouania willdenowi TaxID=441366 RepID=UPI001055B577|nr:uncharacterized protein LOC114465886 isoform X2 [Gouania willdenowi]